MDRFITSAFIDSVIAWFLYDNSFDILNFQNGPYLNWAMGGALEKTFSKGQSISIILNQIFDPVKDAREIKDKDLLLRMFNYGASFCINPLPGHCLIWWT